MVIDQIKADVIRALKSGESLRVMTLRMLLSEINYEQIRVQREITESDVQNVLAREVKKRREAIESFKSAGRTPQADSERVEMEILQEYMPQLLGEDEIRNEVHRVIEALSDQDKGNFGQVMRVVSPLLKGKAEGMVVAAVVKEILNGHN